MSPRSARPWLTWTAGFLAFPLAGLAGRAAAGPITHPLAAVLGGTVTGLVIGLGQSLAAHGHLDPRRWIPATALGLGVGLLLGAALVGYRTTPTALAAMGAATGLSLGLAQASVLPGPATRRLRWALATPLLWALGWTVTTAVGVDVEVHYPVFGATGALAVCALSAPLLLAPSADRTENAR